MSLQEWIDANIKPNVLSVGNIAEYPPEGEVTLYDIGVYATIGADGRVNRLTQPVYKIGATYHFGRNIVKNYEAPVVGKTPEEELVEYLDGLVGEDGYIIHDPISTVSGKAAVVTIGGEKKVIAKTPSGYKVRKFA